MRNAILPAGVPAPAGPAGHAGTGVLLRLPGPLLLPHLARLAAFLAGLNDPAGRHIPAFAIAALVMWAVTASLGGYMLSTWIARGGMQRQRGNPVGLPRFIVLGHMGLALTGLSLWTVYVLTGLAALAWTGVAVLMAVIGLGVSMVTLWTPYPIERVREADRQGTAGAPGAAGPARADGTDGTAGAASAVPDGEPAPGKAPEGGPGGGRGLPADGLVTVPITDELLASALTDEVLAGKLVEDVLTRALAGQSGPTGPARAGRPRPKLTPLIPAGHGVAAMSTFLLAVLTAIGAR